MNQVYLKQQLELAIKQGKMARIDYVTVKGKITKDRLIEPHQLKLRKNDGEPSVVCHCYLRKDIREFMFEGIQSIKLVEKVNYGEAVEDRGDDSAEGEIDEAFKHK